MNSAEPEGNEAVESAAVEYTDDGGAFPPMPGKQSNTLPLWGNKSSMNLNSLILDNISSSPYFKNTLTGLKALHEVVDEIYYNVGHLEPWERGSRRMVGSGGARAMEVRGVSAGGIVSTPYCCLYKLFTLKLTRNQLYSLINHKDSPYIRGLGFMYIRYTQPPDTLWDWFEPYLDDEEEIDPKAGGGDPMTVGQMVKMLLVKLDWYSTLFPRIPVPVQKQLEARLKERAQRELEEQREQQQYEEYDEGGGGQQPMASAESQVVPADSTTTTTDRGRSGGRSDERDRDRRSRRSRSRSRHSRDRKKRHHRSRSRSKLRSKDRRRSRSRHSSRSRSRRHHRKHKHKHSHRSHSSRKHKKSSKERESSRKKEKSLSKERERSSE